MSRKSFVERNTKETYKANQVIEVSKERYNEVKQYVEKINTKKGQG